MLRAGADLVRAKANRQAERSVRGPLQHEAQGFQSNNQAATINTCTVNHTVNERICEVISRLHGGSSIRRVRRYASAVIKAVRGRMVKCILEMMPNQTRGGVVL